MNYARLSALTSAQVAPAPRSDIPDVLWIDDDLPALWTQSTLPHDAVGAAVERLRSDRESEPKITEMMLSCAPAGTRLHGLEARMKSPASTAEKVLRKAAFGESAQETVSRFTDTLRYTLCTVEHDRIVPGARAMLADLSVQGMKVLEASETYYAGAPYKGLHFLIQDSVGTTFELQVHSETSQRVKDEIHEFYEVARGDEVSDERASWANEECARRSATVPTPAGLKEWREVEGCPLEHKGP